MSNRFNRKAGIVLIMAVLLLSTGAYIVENVVIRPFPFFDVTYVTSEKDFNAPPLALPVKISLEMFSEGQIPMWLMKEVEGKKNSNFLEKIKFGVDVTRHIQSNSKGDDVKLRIDIFSKDEKYQSVCSESSKIFVAVSALFGIPARVVWMDGHTVSEAWTGKKWVLVDTYGNVAAYDKNGDMLSLLEVINGYSNVTFQRISSISSKYLADYTRDGYWRKKDNVYSKQPLLFIVGNDYLFEFHRNTKEPLKVLHSVLDLEGEAIGYGLQYVGGDRPFVGNFGLNIIRRF